MSSATLSQESEFEVDDGATKAKIKSAFAKSLKTKKLNKKVLGEFISFGGMKTFQQFMVECNSIQETSLNRIRSKSQKGGISILSGQRGDKSSKENKREK